MKRSKTFLVAALMLAALLLPNMAQAMDITQFDQMTAQDRQSFIDFLPQAAETVLNQEGRSDDAAKVHQLFNAVSSGSNLPLGVGELEMNLDNARVRAVEKQIKNPNAPRVPVEVALIETLGKNGVQITPDFIRALMQLTGTFKPKHT